MQRLIRIQYVFAILFMVGGVLFLAYFHYQYLAPSLLLSNTEFIRNANAIEDIEHMRKLLLVVARGGDSAVMGYWKAIDSAVSLLIAVCFFAAITLFVCASELRKIAKNADTGSENAP